MWQSSSTLPEQGVHLPRSHQTYLALPMLILVLAFLLSLWTCIMVHTIFSPAFHPPKDLLCSLAPGKSPELFSWQLGAGAGGVWDTGTQRPDTTICTGPMALVVPSYWGPPTPLRTGLLLGCRGSCLQGSSNQPGLWSVKGI